MALTPKQKQGLNEYANKVLPKKKPKPKAKAKTKKK